MGLRRADRNKWPFLPSRTSCAKKGVLELSVGPNCVWFSGMHVYYMIIANLRRELFEEGDHAPDKADDLQAGSKWYQVVLLHLRCPTILDPSKALFYVENTSIKQQQHQLGTTNNERTNIEVTDVFVLPYDYINNLVGWFRVKLVLLDDTIVRGSCGFFGVTSRRVSSPPRFFHTVTSPSSSYYV